MLGFIKANAATVIIVLVLLLLIFLAIRKIVRDRKAGIGPCGQKCSECPRASECGKIKE